MYDSDLLRSATPASPQPSRERDRRSRGARPFIFRLLALLLGVGAGMAFFYLPVLAVSQVSVSGLHRLSEQSILDQLSLKGSNILALPVEEVRAQLMTDPWVRTVVVRRSLPNQVTITIEERTPVLLWQASKEQYWVDKDGTVLEPAKTIDPAFPLVEDMDGPTRSSGDKVDADAVSLALALTELLPQELREKAKFFEYLSYAGLVVETDKGRRARFGDSADLEWKLATWKAVLKSTEGQNVKVGHIDLRFGDRPFFRP